MRLQVVNQLIDMMKEINDYPVAKYPSFRVMVYLRNKLVDLGFDVDTANMVMATMDVVIPLEYSENDELMQGVFRLADEMAILFMRSHKEAMIEFGSVEVFLKMIEGANLKIE